MPVNTAEISEAKSTANIILPEKISGVRVSPNAYFIALFLLTFIAGLLVYLGVDAPGTFIFAFGWLTIPFLFSTDRITFDGKRLIRTGILPRFWAKLNKSKYRLKISEIEQIETRSVRILKRGENVAYRYQTTISGGGLNFVFASGSAAYRQIIHKLFPLVSENALDNRSIELRDFFNERKEILMKAEFAKIPSPEVLENSFGKLKVTDKKLRKARWKNAETSVEAAEKAEYLHQLANELRLYGYLLQALEAFRRALYLNPRDARLIFDFSRCLHSFAAAEKDDDLTRRAFAALRLAEKRAENNADILARLGESYFQYGDWKRAEKVFQKGVAAADENFRARRGLAEIALREGKIAHVIHHFSNANRLAESAALRRWTANESEYFARLNEDDDYMELEVKRVNLLEGLERSKKTCLQIAFFSFPAIFIGILLEEKLMADVGWAVSSIALLVWAGVIVSQTLFSPRIPLDLQDND